MKKQLHWLNRNDKVSGQTSFTGDSFTVLSWNVFKGYGGHKFLDSMHSLVGKHSPDVVVFQEAPMFPGGTFLDWPKSFNPKSVVYVSSQKKIPGIHDYEHTGELVASQIPHLDASFHLLPKITNQKLLHNDEYLHRNFVYLRWNTRAGTLGLYNVHFESMTIPVHRMNEVLALYNQIEKNDDDITIVAGDFNTFMTTALEPALQFFKKKGFVNGLKPGIKQWLPRRDHIFVRGAKSVSTSVLKGMGSDHKPIIAKIKI